MRLLQLSKICTFDNCSRRIDLVHKMNSGNQIDAPAAIVKDLYVWCGNSQCAELCGVSKNKLVGMGIEKIVHPSSLEQVISHAKERSLGNFAVPEKCSLNIKNHQSDKITIDAGVFPLTEPQDAYLVLVESIQIP